MDHQCDALALYAGGARPCLLKEEALKVLFIHAATLNPKISKHIKRASHPSLID
jgi:hypothetical protein